MPAKKVPSQVEKLPIPSTSEKAKVRCPNCNTEMIVASEETILHEVQICPNCRKML